MNGRFHGTETKLPRQKPMLVFSLILSGLITSVAAATNSNTCLPQVPALRGCFSRVFATPECCAAIQTYQNSRCFCNSLASSLLDTQNPAQIAWIVKGCQLPSIKCDNFATYTYNGGTCSTSDVDLDKARFYKAFQFSGLLLSMGAQVDTCFNYGQFLATMGTFFNPEVVAYAGQGLGIYSGINAVAEYLSLLSPVVNKGFVRLVEAPPEVSKPVAYFSPAGNSITVGKNVVNKFINLLYYRNDTDYLESTMVFNGCDTKASMISIPASSALFPGKLTGVVSLAETLYLTANTQKFIRTRNGAPAYPAMMGYKSICQQHAKFCTGANAQFSSIFECETFFLELLKLKPLTPCGTTALVSGNTAACRAKHQFMIQINPTEHCPHLSRNSMACNDMKCEVPGPADAVNLTLSTDLQEALFRVNSVIAANFDSSKQWKYSNYC